MTDIATRAYNHTFKLDPVVRSLMDTDFYKLLMMQFIWSFHRETRVTFGLINRTRAVRIADEIGENELREQLDHARSLRFQKKELIWLQGNTFYGKSNIFDPAFIAWLADFALPDYQLEKRDGQYELTFSGPWTHTTMWEIPALAIINELRSRAAIRLLGKFEIDVLYARGKAKLWDKIERLRKLRSEGPLKIADFGTRRRHGFLWQKWCNEALREGIGDCYIGTSNVLLAQDLGQEAIGTNAHELPMTYAALADSDEALRASRYRILADWAKIYQGNLGVILPDAYGTTSFLADAPDWVAGLKGARPDSKDPIEGGDELVAWWRARGEDPQKKLLILSDGMDIDSIESCVRHFRGVAPISIGWGTNLTNDFLDCSPRANAPFNHISLVCKAVEANGRPVVKLSDNFAKATGPRDEIQRYIRVFGAAGMQNRPVTV